MNWDLFAAFLVITLILMITPGPIVTLVLATGAKDGVHAALTTVLGTVIGNALLLAAIACGLHWVLAFSAALFEIMRWAGAAYLVWLGIRAWRRAGVAAQLEVPRGRVYFSRGLLVATTNPKTLAFFTAFLPQFVDPALPVGRQLLVMCVVSVLMAAVTDSAWAVMSGLGRAWLLAPTRATFIGRCSALALIGGGLWLSLARRPG